MHDLGMYRDQEGSINDHRITRHQKRHKGACKTIDL